MVPLKKEAKTEAIFLKAFTRHEICLLPLSKVNSHEFAKYRDEWLLEVKAATIRRQFNAIHHMFEIARNEWGTAIKEVPSTGYLSKTRITDEKDASQKRNIKS